MKYITVNRVVILFIIVSVSVLVFFIQQSANKQYTSYVCEKPEKYFWQIQSVDTMKQSRDLARAKLSDKSFGSAIDKQASDISKVGATHIAISTPYDKEFIPFLQRWVNLSRKYNLNVWFRGNWSGWEGWFGYSKQLSREKHIQKTVGFILNNPELFKDGDVFSPCPECENGGPGDPRQTGDTVAYRKFIIKEYQETKKAFLQINKKVQIFFPMNGDVAKLIMDKKTTQLLGGYVVVDHYVKGPKKLSDDLNMLAISSGGKVVLGEFGAPIPDVHGRLSEKEQAEWIDNVLRYISQNKDLAGINYWVNVGGSTAIWNKNRTPKKAVSVLQNAFQPRIIYGQIADESGQSVGGAKVVVNNNIFYSDKNGCFSIKFIPDRNKNFITIQADKFIEDNLTIDNNINHKNVVLIAKDRDWRYKIRLWLYKKFKK